MYVRLTAWPDAYGAGNKRICGYPRPPKCYVIEADCLGARFNTTTEDWGLKLDIPMFLSEPIIERVGWVRKYALKTIPLGMELLTEANYLAWEENWVPTEELDGAAAPSAVRAADPAAASLSCHVKKKAAKGGGSSSSSSSSSVREQPLRAARAVSAMVDDSSPDSSDSEDNNAAAKPQKRRRGKGKKPKIAEDNEGDESDCEFAFLKYVNKLPWMY